MGVCFVMGRIIDVDFELVCSGGGRGVRVLVVGGVVLGGGMNFVRERILSRASFGAKMRHSWRHWRGGRG